MRLLEIGVLTDCCKSEAYTQALNLASFALAKGNKIYYKPVKGTQKRVRFHIYRDITFWDTHQNNWQNTFGECNIDQVQSGYKHVDEPTIVPFIKGVYLPIANLISAKNA